MTDSMHAVYFSDEDYARLPRRLLAFVVDLIVVILLAVVLLVAFQILVVPADVRAMPRSEEQQKRLNEAVRPYRIQMLLTAAVPVLAYHVMLRTSRNGTIGYRLAGIRLVTHLGAPPDLRRAGRRFLLAVPACMALAVAYLSTLSDARRQAFHDRWAGTWMVRKHAQPAGPADVQIQIKLFGPWALKYDSLAPA